MNARASRSRRSSACRTPAAASGLPRLVRSDPALDEKAIKAHCAEHLVNYQRPTALIFVDSLPRNAMGKVLRRELRDRLAGGG